MLRCTASLVTATYIPVQLVPRDLRALPLEIFTKSCIFNSIMIFSEIIYSLLSTYFFLGSCLIIPLSSRVNRIFKTSLVFNPVAMIIPSTSMAFEDIAFNMVFSISVNPLKTFVSSVLLCSCSSYPNICTFW